MGITGAVLKEGGAGVCLWVCIPVCLCLCVRHVSMRRPLPPLAQTHLREAVQRFRRRRAVEPPSARVEDKVKRLEERNETDEGGDWWIRAALPVRCGARAWPLRHCPPTPHSTRPVPVSLLPPRIALRAGCQRERITKGESDEGGD